MTGQPSTLRLKTYTLVSRKYPNFAPEASFSRCTILLDFRKRVAVELSLVDDLRREAFITEAVWTILTKYFDTQRLIELIMTSGGYAMTGVVMASIGLQIEPGLPGFPEVSESS